ncbi:MAG TPA: hypothetical protein VMV46_21985 [Thermoanaerobaculia bacterium]|nr:hypothetical protein [Thermoanaerobaculia bacterium]
MTPTPTLPSSPARPDGAAAGFSAGFSTGFSTIEALLAGVLLLIMSLGVLPLFTQSLTNNRQGKLASDATNEARSELERFTQLGFDSPDLTIPPGAVELESEAYFSDVKRRWIAADDYNDGADGFRLFTRTTTVRQYNFEALDNDNLLDPGEALDGGAPRGEVHFKEILVQVEANALRAGPNKFVTLRTLKTS